MLNDAYLNNYQIRYLSQQTPDYRGIRPENCQSNM